MARKYLNDLGLNDELMDLEDAELQKFDDEIKEYGFASYETWNLDYQFYGWLYERLKRYLDVTSDVINLGYHKFEFEGKEYNQKQLIEKMIHGCELALTHDDYAWSDADLTEEERKAIHDVPYIWAVVMSAMWW